MGSLPPVGSLFAAFLGFNPVAELLGPTGVLKTLPAHNAATLTGREFFPQLVTAPFHHGRVVVFVTAAIMSVIGAFASLVGGRRVHGRQEIPVPRAAGRAGTPAAAPEGQDGAGRRPGPGEPVEVGAPGTAARRQKR